MSSVVAVVKSIIGQVIAVSPEGAQRVLVEGDRIYQGEQLLTGASGAVTLDVGKGKLVDLGRDSQWSSADLPQAEAHHAAAQPANAPSTEDLQKAIAAGLDPTQALAPTAAGPTAAPSAAGGNGGVGGGHSFVVLDATAGHVDPTIGYTTAGLDNGGSAGDERQGELPANLAPQFEDGGNGVLNLTTAEDTLLTGAFSARDPNGDLISYSVGQAPANGLLVLNPDGTWQYNPNGDYNGADSFTVIVTDSRGASSTLVVNVGITPVNDAPVATGTYTSAITDTAANDSFADIKGQLTATDVDDTNLTWSGSAKGAYGELTVNADGSYTYVVDANAVNALPLGQNPSESFTVTVTDPSGATDTRVITLNVQGANDTPVAQDGQASGNEDSVIGGQLVATDRDTGSTLTFTTNGNPPAGFTLKPDGSWTFDGKDPAYQHLAEGETQIVQVPYTVTDEHGATSTATLTVTLTGTNDAPVALPGAATTEENTVLNGQVPAASDVDGSVAGYQLTTGVGNGNGNLTFNPDGSYSFNPGKDFDSLAQGETRDVTFTYQAKDNNGALSDPQTITITVTGTNDAPVALPGAAITEENTVLNGQVPAASDVDGSVAGYQLTTDVGNGNGNLTFNPDGSYSFNPGKDFDSLAQGETRDVTFTYQAKDNNGALSDPQTITITVTGTNDAAVITGQTSGSADETNAPVTLDGKLNITDVDGPASFQVQTDTAGTNGKFSVAADGSWSYVANSAFNELKVGEHLTDTFVVKAADGTSTHVTVTINGTNDAPVASAATATTEENAVLNGQVPAATDVDGTVVSYQLTTDVAQGKGSLTFNGNGSYSFDPGTAFDHLAAGAQETVTFTYQAKDNNGALSDPQTVTITVTGTNDAPVAYADSATTEENTVFNGQVPAATDVDGSIAGYQLTTGVGANNGTLTFNADGSYSFNPGKDFDSLADGESRDITFTYQAKDDNDALSAPQTITITVTGSNDAPVASATTGAVKEDAQISGQLAATDADNGAQLSYALDKAAPAGFSVDADGKWTFDASGSEYQHLKAGATQTLSIPFTVTDEHGATSSSSLTITITGTNDAPVANAASAKASEDKLSFGKLTASDVDDGAKLSFSLNDKAPAGFTLFKDGTWAFSGLDPAYQSLAAGETKVLSIDYTVTDEHGATSTNTLTLTVTGTNDTPIALPSLLNGVKEDAQISGELKAIDVDNGAQLTYSLNKAAPAGLILGSDGKWSFDAGDAAYQHLKAGATQLISVGYTVTDEHGASTQSVLVITVTGTNDAPKADAATAAAQEDAVSKGQLTATDVDDGAKLSFSVSGNPPAGFTLKTDGSWTFDGKDPAYQSLAEGETKDIQVKYIVTDEHGATDTQTLTITVTGSNDPAVIGGVASVNVDETNAPVTTGGLLTVSDVDGPASFQAQSNVAGKYGTFSLGSDGTWTYTANDAYNELKQDEKLTDSFTVKATDGTSATVTVNIVGTNDAPVAFGDTRTTGENTAFTSQVPVATDIDGSVVGYQLATDVGQGHGSLTFNADGSYTFEPGTDFDHLAAGESQDVTFTYQAKDDNGALSDPQTITITVTGSNDAAVISGQTSVSVNETNAPISTSGQLTISDVDSPETFQAQSNVAGKYGTFNLGADGQWTYTAKSAYNELKVGETLVDTFAVKAADGTASSVTVNIVGTNDAPVAYPASASAVEGGIKDLGVVASATDGSSVTLTITTTQPGEAVSFNWKFSTNDGGSYNDFAYVQVNGQKVQLLSSVSTVGDGGNSGLQTFQQVFDKPGTYTIVLGVSDATDTAVDSTLVLSNLPSQVSVGNVVGQVTHTGSNWTLTTNGANNTTLGNQLKPVSEITGKLQATDVDHNAQLTFSTAQNTAGFTLKSDGSWLFDAKDPAYDNLAQGETQTLAIHYTVTDEHGASDTSILTLTITGTNDAPVAGVMKETVYEDSKIGGQLAGSDVDHNAVLTFATTGSLPAGFSSDSSGKWSFDASNAAYQHLAVGATQVFTVNYSVTDQYGAKSTSTLTITVIGTNDAPQAKAASASVNEDKISGGTLTATDVDDGHALYFSLKDAAPSGFTLNADGTWSFNGNHADYQKLGAGESLELQIKFIVTDDKGATDENVLTLTVNGSNDAAIISGAKIVNVYETDAPITTTGKLDVSDVDGPDSFQAQTNVAGKYGTFNLGTDGNWTYVAKDAYNELKPGETLTDTFTVKAADGTSSSVTVNILGTNDAPTAYDDSVTIDENGRVNGKVPAATDPDGKVSSYQLVTDVGQGNGSLNFNSSGTYHFEPGSDFDHLAAGESQVVTFTYQAKDDNGALSDPKTITITVTGSNDAAVISGVKSSSVNETDAPVSTSGKLNVSDVDGPETFQAQNNVAGKYGTFNLGTDGNWTYVAKEAYNELKVGQTYTDTFTVKAADGTSATVTVNIVGTNDAPAAFDGSAATGENTVLNGQVPSATDVDGTIASYQLATDVAAGKGTLTFNANGSYSFNPGNAFDHLAAGQSETVSFTYQAKDNNGALSDAKTITITVNGTNDAPVAYADSQTTEENTVLNGQVPAATDVDGTVASYQLDTGVAAGKGTLTFNSDGSYSFNPGTAFDHLAAGQSEAVTFTYQAKDNDGALSDPKTITITVTGTNDAAVITGQTSGSADETNAPVTIDGKLNVTDVDGPASFQVQTDTAGTFGKFSVAADGTWSYVTNEAYNELKAGEHQTESFNVLAADGTSTTVTVTLNGTNDAPVAYADSQTTEENTVLNGQVPSATDVDGTVASYQLATNVAAGKGTLTFNSDGSYSFNPGTAFDHLAAGQTQDLTFTYQAKDNNGALSDPKTITITVTGTNDAAVITGQTSGSADETNAPVTIAGKLIVNDVDSQAVFQTQTNTAGTNGKFSVAADGTWSYVANSAFNELKVGEHLTDTFVVKAADGTSTNVTVTINGTNDAPVAYANTQTTGENTVLQGKVPAATDVDGTIASYQLATNVAAGKGTLTFNADGSYTFNPGTAFDHLAAGAHETVTFTYQAKDNNGALSDPKTITIDVTGTNDRPVAVDGTASTEENTVLHGQVPAASDIDGTVVGYQLTTDVAQGKGSLVFNANGSYTFTPGTAFDHLAAGQSETVTFTYQAKDDAGALSDPKTITITVNGSNDAPNGADNTITLNEDSSRSFTVADFGFSDADAGDTLSGVRIDSLPSNGTLKFNGNAVTAGQVIDAADLGKLVFTPAANANGNNYANFTFSVKDSSNTYDTTPNKITFNVTPVNDAPVAVNDNFTLSGLKGNYWGYNEGPDGSNLTSLSQVTAFMNGHAASATFTSTTLNYNLSGGDLGGDGNLQKFLGNDAGSLNTDPANTSDAIIQLTGAINLNAGNYQLRVNADDGFSIKIDGVEVFKYDAIQSPTGRESAVFTIAQSGNHSIEIVYWDQGGQAQLQVEMRPQGGTYATVGGTALTHAVGELVTNEDTALTIAPQTLLGNDSDVDGDSLTIVSVQNAVNGSVKLEGGNVVFTPAKDFNGSGSFTYTISDGHGGTSTATVTVGVNAVNDAPEAKNDLQTTGENNTLNGQVPAATDIDSAVNPNGYALVQSVGAGNGTLVFNANGSYVFNPGTDFDSLNVGESRQVTFTYTAKDAQGAVSAPATVTITVTGSNDLPTATDSTVTLNEDGKRSFSASDFGFSDKDAGDALKAIRIDNLPSAGSLTLNGQSVTAGQVIAVSLLASLVYTPVANAAGNAYATLKFSVQDSHDGFSSSSSTLTFNVTPVNDAPLSADGSASVYAGKTYTFALKDFAFSDTADSANGQNHSLQNILIKALPATGSLLLNGQAVTAGQSIKASDVSSGKLTYVPDSSGSNAHFEFAVQDSGGVANGGVDTSGTYGFDIHVGQVQIPSTNPNGDNTLTGGSGDDVILGDVGGIKTLTQGGTNYNIALVVDTSGSMAYNLAGQSGAAYADSRMKLVKDALINLANELKGHDGIINISLIGFQSSATLKVSISDLSDANINQLLTAIGQSQSQGLQASGGTDYQEAFGQAVSWFNTQKNGYENVTLFLTDGDPTESSGSGTLMQNTTQAFASLSALSEVRAIGIGTNVNESTLKYFDNTSVTGLGTVSYNTTSTLFTFDNNSALPGWTLTKSSTGSVGISGNKLSMTDTSASGSTTAITSDLTVTKNSTSTFSFDFTESMRSGDTFTWTLKQFVNGAWSTVETHTLTSSSSNTTYTTDKAVGEGTYRIDYVLTDNTTAGTATVTLDNLKQITTTQAPTGQVDIVKQASDLTAALHGGSTSTELAPSGHDTISGGAGDDIIFGDTINTDNLPWGVNGNPAKPADMPAGSGVSALSAFLELKNGHTATSDEMYDYIKANHALFNVEGDTRGGDDHLYGGDGNDILYGQGGNDFLFGENGNDILFGGTGDDQLTGGKGDDILTGGAGADTFIWKAGDIGNDTITDFKAGEGDRIDISDLLPETAHNDILSYLKVDTTTSTLQVSTTGQINTGGAADVTIKLSGVDLSAYGSTSTEIVNKLVAGSDPVVKTEHH
ncbi:hypothetical protein UB43_07150 [Pseudomonas sp. 21]|uniref:retention module-containing protein n=1 Tax=Pseudomonas sp. 21 TaxID=1619948 RepID=UPI0005EB19A3|nr:retention module-containing protein [Pseudomonas sp. 21]KJK01817.1 hypothetical protein UB43_07150 [Pseudomonas sp. 21]